MTRRVTFQLPFILQRKYRIGYDKDVPNGWATTICRYPKYCTASILQSNPDYAARRRSFDERSKTSRMEKPMKCDVRRIIVRGICRPRWWRFMPARTSTSYRRLGHSLGTMKTSPFSLWLALLFFGDKRTFVQAAQPGHIDHCTPLWSGDRNYDPEQLKQCAADFTDGKISQNSVPRC